LTEPIFTGEVLHARFLRIAVITNFAGLLFRWFGAYAVLAHQIRLAAVRSIA
jgi:hypothetical protein